MLRIEQIAAQATCKHVALLLEKQCDALASRNVELARELARLRGRDQLVADFGETEQPRRNSRSCSAPSSDSRRNEGRSRQPMRHRR